MSYIPVFTLGIIFGCLSRQVWTTSEPVFFCDDAKYFPCKCSSQTVSSLDYAPITCEDVPMDKIIKVIKKTKADGIKEIYVGIKNNELTTLQSNFIGSVPVKGLSVQSSKLKNVDENAFLGQENSLESIEFTGCDLSSIPVKALSKLNKLKYLQIENSKSKTLEHITKDTFAGLTNAGTVRQLTLTNNGIKTIEEGALSQFTNIVYIYLNDNDLSELKVNALTPQKLDLIELYNNTFSQVPIELVRKISSGGTLNLQYNNIVNVSPAVIAETIKSGIHINVYENNLRCDCAFKEMAEYKLVDRYGNKIHGKCVWPESLKGKPVHSLTVSDFPNC